MTWYRIWKDSCNSYRANLVIPMTMSLCAPFLLCPTFRMPSSSWMLRDLRTWNSYVSTTGSSTCPMKVTISFDWTKFSLLMDGASTSTYTKSKNLTKSTYVTGIFIWVRSNKIVLLFCFRAKIVSVETGFLFQKWNIQGQQEVMRRLLKRESD